MQISTIGLDIAKNVFEVHGIDAAEKVVVRKRCDELGNRLDRNRWIYLQDEGHTDDAGDRRDVAD